MQAVVLEMSHSLLLLINSAGISRCAMAPCIDRQSRQQLIAKCQLPDIRP